MAESFWSENNVWWFAAIKRMTDDTAAEDDWAEASRRLWCLTVEVLSNFRLSPHDRQDLVQNVLLRLQNPDVRRALTETGSPTHYLARIMENLVRNDLRRERVAGRIFR